MTKKTILLLVGIICYLAPLQAESGTPALEKVMQSVPGLQVEEIKAKAPFIREFRIFLEQPLDHDDPESEPFRQQLILSHRHQTKPMVLVTEGYSMGRDFTRELSELLQCNQLRVEHRYFGQSKPSEMKWQFLNLKQAAADYHRIVSIFKKFYKNKWLSTGWSKGGQTSLAYRSYYPDDVAVTVAYDAPLNLARRETRIDQFFDGVGSPKCRKILWAFQRLVLKNKAKILPLAKEYAREKTYNFSIGMEKALEYVVLEYTFSFWQYHDIDCETIPGPDATPRELFDHLKKAVSFGSYADRSMNSAAMYQFYTEFGYYGYVTRHLKDLLSHEEYPNDAYAPKNVALIYNPGIMKALNRWLRSKGNNILYIYGDRDPWSAPQVATGGRTNAVKAILKGGNHFTFINSFPEKTKAELITTLRNWLQ